MSLEHFNPVVDGEFFKLAQSAPDSPALFSSGCPEHQFEGKYRLQPGDTFVEAGAFWGRYGLIASHRVGSEGRVILIEGNPKNAEVIESVIRHYNLLNVELVQGIVWSRDDTEKFCTWGDPSSSRRAIEADLINFPDDVIEVKSYTLDTLLEQLRVEQVDLLAADVEGAEVEMVKGTEKYLSKKIRNVAIAAYHMPGFPKIIMEILERKGFKDLFYDPSLPQYGAVVYGHHRVRAEEERIC